MAKLTIKFISKVNRIGSSEGTASRVRDRSKAAGKLNMTFGVNVRDKVPATKQVKPDDATRVITVQEENISLEDAIIIGNALLDHMDRQSNSERYTARKSSFDSKKREILASFNVSSYETLTSDERIMYAKQMVASRAPFHYTECSIHVRVDDKQTVYSKTHRKNGAVHWTESQATSLIDAAKRDLATKEVVLSKGQHVQGSSSNNTTP